MATFRHVTVKCKSQTYFKSAFKILSACSNTSLKAGTSLPDCFSNDHLVEMFPLFDQVRLQLGDVMNLVGCDTHAPAAAFHRSLGLGQDNWLARQLEQ